MNEVALIGRLTKDPELVETKNGKKRIAMTLAVSRSFKNIDGVYETDFIHMILWDGIAQHISEYCKCGDLVGIKGRLQSNNYDDAEGNKKTTMEVVAEKVTFLSSKKEQKAE